MNRFPAWLNLLVLSILLLGCVFALPNVYGTAPAVQLVGQKGADITENQLEDYLRVLSSTPVTPEAAYIDDGRAVLRFTSIEDQALALERLGARFASTASVAQTLAPRLPDWLRQLGLRPMSLGLDLRGGVHFLLEVDMDAAIQTRMTLYEQGLVDTFRDEQVRTQVLLDGDEIRVRVRRAEDMELVRDLIERADPDLLVLDGNDGSSYRVRMTEAQIKARQDFAIEQNITTLRNRVNELGVAEPLVQRQGVDRIVVQLPGVDDPALFTRILTATATVEFRLVDESGDAPGSKRYPGRGAEPAQVLKRGIVASGDQIIDAAAGFDQGAIVHITLDSAAGEKMLVTTRENLNKPMSTVFIETERVERRVNGETVYRTVKSEEIINTATIRGVFKDKFQISGLTPAEAGNLALLLRAGALAAPVYKIEERTIGPSLGRKNIDRGFQAVTIGFLAVIAFMALYYRGFGLIANVALLSNLVFIVALLSMLQASLTLPGIAGIVLTVGMAVDANVLIFERIREELASGNSIQASISAGYEKALSSIADANVTTLIAAIVLFAQGTGPIKGFAITLALGIITSMFTAIIGTRAIVNLAFGSRRLDSLPI